LPSRFEKVIPIGVKRILANRFAGLFSLMVAGVLHASPTNLLPGIAFYDGSEKLTGKLVFLVQHDYTIETNSENAASVYEFDLQKKKLNKIADSPVGQFGIVPEGNAFCTIFWNDKYSMGKDTNVFVYSEISESSHWTNIESPPQGMFVADNRVFMKLQGYNFSSAGYYLVTNGNPTETKLIEYDFEKNQLRAGDFSAQWQNHESSGETFKTFDGRYVFFEGRDAPIDGLTFVSSSWNFRDFKDQDPKGEKTKVLHKFSMLSAFSTTHELLQLSPDRHFALVRTIEPINIGIHMYSDDANDTSPSSTTTNHIWAYYKELTQGYFGLGDAPTNLNKLFACPADTFHYNFDGNGKVWFVPQGQHELPTSSFSSYFFNGANEFTNMPAGHPLLGIAGRKLSLIKHPARTILVTEWPAIIPYSWHEPKQPISDVNNCAFNNAKDMAAFVDGHVGYIRMYLQNTNTLSIQYDPPSEYDYQWSGN